MRTMESQSDLDLSPTSITASHANALYFESHLPGLSILTMKSGSAGQQQQEAAQGV